MSNTPPADPNDESPVGPFTGFGNFFLKELRDWRKSWRLIIIFAIPTLIQTLTVFFGYRNIRDGVGRLANFDGSIDEKVATYVLLLPFLQLAPALFILIVIFSTMGLLTTEKSTGTLAWNLTKPLGRTGLLVAKWLAATLVIWLAAVVLPVAVASICMMGYIHTTPDFSEIAPIVAGAAAWVALWVLLVLTISLGFQSQAAVGGVAIAFWIVPFLFATLLGQVFGEKIKEWILDLLAPRSPFWAPALFLEKHYLIFHIEKIWKPVWAYAFAAWAVVLAVFSLRIFNRQEIGS